MPSSRFPYEYIPAMPRQLVSRSDLAQALDRYEALAKRARDAEQRGVANTQWRARANAVRAALRAWLEEQ
jgi:hypothetical protein